MITQEAALCAIRFGYGLHPDQRPPAGPDALMAALAAPPPPDRSAPPVEERLASVRRLIMGRRMRNREEAGGEAMLNQGSDELRVLGTGDVHRLFGRAIGGENAFYERLSLFWADHFTVEWLNRRISVIAADLIETAIRPHITGRFPDMLKAVARHPSMLRYLDHDQVAGPNSPVAQRNRRAGMNENLAREILELHTLGVDGNYSQTDVRQFAELLTGFHFTEDGFVYEPGRAEPGAETVLGVSYGGPEGRARDVDAALEDLGMNPITARHLASKLITHFLGPIEGRAQAVERMVRAYLKADGALMPMYAALLDAPGAFELPLQKAKTPFEFVVSASRAFGATRADVDRRGMQAMRVDLMEPMAKMGMPLMQAGGPDGWPEAPETWITPPGLAARIEWAHKLAQTYGEGIEPASFVDSTLGPIAGPLLRRAVPGAETKVEGLTLVLASPEFNRR